MCIRDRHVVVVDRLDKGLKYVSSSHNGVYDEASHTVTWVVDIAAGSSLDLTVTEMCIRDRLVIRLQFMK